MLHRKFKVIFKLIIPKTKTHTSAHIHFINDPPSYILFPVHPFLKARSHRDVTIFSFLIIYMCVNQSWHLYTFIAFINLFVSSFSRTIIHIRTFVVLHSFLFSRFLMGLSSAFGIVFALNARIRVVNINKGIYTIFFA